MSRAPIPSLYDGDAFDEAITIGPLGLFFTNVNDQMGLPGHSHHAQLLLTFRSTGSLGFPAFDSTVRALQDRLKELTAIAFRWATNEEVLRRLFAGFDGWTHPAIARWSGARFELVKAQLGVQGVLDEIGHSDGITWYTIKRKG